MKVIVGLGNPGAQYCGTRHNMGRDVLDKFSDIVKGDFNKYDFKGEYGIVNNAELPEKIIIVKPETFMNLSGECVSPLLSYYKVGVEDLLVVFDDMSLPEGTIRLRPDGSSGGQKGMQNIIEKLGTDKIKRIKIGIGEPEHGKGVDWVLGKPTGEHKGKLNDATDKAAKAILEFILNGFDKAMSKFN